MPRKKKSLEPLTKVLEERKEYYLSTFKNQKDKHIPYVKKVNEKISNYFSDLESFLYA